MLDLTSIIMVFPKGSALCYERARSSFLRWKTFSFTFLDFSGLRILNFMTLPLSFNSFGAEGTASETTALANCLCITI